MTAQSAVAVAEHPPSHRRLDLARLIVPSNKNFSSWAEIFGDAVAVAAMVDRLVHHAQVIVLKGQSYRLRGKRKEITH